MARKKRCDKEESWQPIDGEIKDFFRSYSLKARTLCRKNSLTKFGMKNSPHNLIPSEEDKAESDLTVFVEFRGDVVARGEIRLIIAFPNSRDHEFCLLDNPAFGAPKQGKADLRICPEISCPF